MQGTQVPGVSEGLRVDIPGGPARQGRGHGAQGFVAFPVAVPIAPHTLHRHGEVLSVNPGDSETLPSNTDDGHFSPSRLPCSLSPASLNVNLTKTN